MAVKAAFIPSQQNAAIKQGNGKTATTPIKQVKVPQPGPGQILVKINWTGICRSDKSLIYDEWANFGVGMQSVTGGVAGHEGAGVVIALGEGSDKLWKVGDGAGIKWIASTCGHCKMCKEPDGETLCLRQTNSGLTAAGTFQEYTLAPADYATRIPDGVTDEEAGPILCAGVTAYVACKRSAVHAGQWIVIVGAGGGLGHFAVQYAKAMGMRPIAIDAGEDKKKMCLELGAEKFVDFTQVEDIAKEILAITGLGAHGIVVTTTGQASSKTGYESAPQMLRGNGTLVTVGLPLDPAGVAGAHPMLLCGKKLNIVGAKVGTKADVDEALGFTVRGLVHPRLTKGTLKNLEHFCKEMDAGRLVGRAVLKVCSD